ncbi:MAG: PAS domain S-box protein, partial [Bacteroidota bacterium]
MNFDSVFQHRLLLFILLICWLSPFRSLGKGPVFHHLMLSDDSRLQNQLIKSISQSDHGRLWLLTDAGLLQYENNHFRQYSYPAYIHYPKSLLRAQNGTNWILGDMGLYEIIQQNDSLVYQQHLTGAAKFEDDKIYYGKNLYEDRQGSLWIGAIRDIYTYEDGKLYSYPQDSSFQTEDFDHAYAFAEDKRDVLWAANYNGFLGYYDERQDQWTWLDLKLPLSRITSLLYDTTQHSLYLGASEGVYQFDIASQELHPIYEGNPVLCMATQNTHLWWGDNRGEIMNYSLATKQKNKAAYLGNVEISCFFEIGDGNLWFGSNNGLGMVYEQAFSPLRPDDREEDLYIESIQAHNGDIYFCDRYRLYRQDATGHVSVLLNDPVSYLTSISFIGDTLWLSSRNGPRIRVNGQFQWVEQVRGDFFYTLSDQHQQLWVCHMDQSGISRYDGSLLRRTLLAPDYPSLSFTIIREGPDGKLYLGAQGNQSLLYRYDPATDQLQNLLHPQPLAEHISINDLAIGEDGKVWLATNIGLFHWREGEKQITPYPLQGNDRFPSVVAIQYQNTSHLWLGVGTDVLLIQPEEKLQYRFGTRNGLPSAEIANHNLVIHDGRLLAGTHRAMFQLDLQQIKRSATPAPTWQSSQLKKQIYKDEAYAIKFQDRILFTPFLASQAGTVALYRYRLPNKSAHWIYLQNREELSVQARQPGPIEIELQAQRFGFHDWSKSEIIRLDVQRPWYLQTWYWLIGLVVMFLVASVAARIKTRMHKAREAQLQRSVDMQTIALKNALDRERQMKVALSQSETRYRMLFESARDGIMIIKEDKVILANEQAYRMFGYKKEEFIGISLRELYPDLQPDGRYSEEKALRQLARSRWDAYYEHWKQKHKDGSLFDAELSLNRFRIEGEGYIQIIFRNITERIEAKEARLQQFEELNRKNKELQELLTSNAELENFAYVVSHDLREPLRSISSFANLLERRYNDQLDREGQEFLAFVVRGAKSMNELILDMLDFSRITRTKEPKTWVSFPKLTHEVLELLQKQIYETRANITLGSLPN